jgi:hypothetical protein
MFTAPAPRSYGLAPTSVRGMAPGHDPLRRALRRGLLNPKICG